MMRTIIKTDSPSMALSDGRTAISWASERGHEGFINEFLEHTRGRHFLWQKPFWKPQIVDTPDEDGRTPLWHATTNRQNGIIKLLIRKNVKINKPDDFGFTPLHMAIYNGDL